MSKVKKQHFVPRFYLKNFVNQNGKIFAFDITKGNSFGTSIENIAHRKFFYDFDSTKDFGGDQIIEKALAKFEGQSAQIFRKLIGYLEKGDLSEFTTKDRLTLAEYIIIQQARTLESRVTGQHFAQELERQLISKGGTKEFILASGLEASKFDAKAQQLFGLMTPPLMRDVEDLSNRIWVFWDNKTKNKFLSSDHPVVGYNHEDRSYSAYELYFPLSPRFGLSILIEDEFKDWIEKDNTIVIIDDPEFIKFYNSLILVSCNRQIYNQEDDFQLAKEIVKKTPGLSKPNRPRLELL